LIPIDPKLREQGHCESHHRWGVGNQERLASDAREPVALPTVMPFDGVRCRVPLHQLVLRDDRRLCGPWICAIPLHVPLGEALAHLPQGRFVTATTVPVQKLTRIRSQGLPDPPLPPRVLEGVPPLVQRQDERVAGGFRLLVVLLSHGSEPVEHGLGRYPQEAREAMPGETAQISAHRVDRQHDRLTAWGGPRTRIPTRLAELCGLAGDRAVVDGPITLALGTYLHRYPPCQTEADLSGGRSITGGQHSASLLA
jgi:hypothetical protein